MKKIKIISIGILSLSMLSIAGLALAMPTADPSPAQIAANVFSVVSGVMYALAGIAFLWAGLLYVTAGGSEDKIEKAKTILIFGIVGIIVALIAGNAIPWVQRVFM